MRTGGSDAGRAALFTPFGPLWLDEVLQAQGADLSYWASTTNIYAISSDGRWLAGQGRTTREGAGGGRMEAFRAKLSLHADSELSYAIEILPDRGNIVRIKWPVADLLVTLESKPQADDTAPWQVETGLPRVEGNEIVLDLENYTRSRIFRMSRID
jgi:hypothetical protein